jgi:hypothetical protein
MLINKITLVVSAILLNGPYDKQNKDMSVPSIAA